MTLHSFTRSLLIVSLAKWTEQGGIGKTTIAAALVHDHEVRSSFEKIVWVSLGQDPNLRTLADSIHYQLTKQGLAEDIKDERDALDAIRDAAKDKKVLLVLDDVWNPSHEKPLNCIDPNGASRLLVTTRIRGLLKNSQEVSMGVLSEDEALAMLLKYAKVESLDEASVEYCRANEVVSLCGKLPLTIAIAGGMVASSSQGFTEDMVAMMKTDLGKEMRDESGMTVEERIIASSIKQIGSHGDSTTIEAIFRHFAVFPEDFPVPKPLFDVISPMLVPRSSSRAACTTKVSSCVAVLMNYNLLKGSLANGDGVYMHDIVRDYVISLASDQDLRVKQKQMVEILLQNRPPGGFEGAQHTSTGSLEGYVAKNIAHHMRGAMQEGEVPPYDWLAHRDLVVVTACAMAVGSDGMKAQINAAESSDPLLASRLTYALLSSQLTRVEDEADLVYKCVDLLEKASKRRGGYGRNEEESRRFHLFILRFAFIHDAGSDRNQKARADADRMMNPPQSFGARIGGCILGAIASPACLRCILSLAGPKNEAQETYASLRMRAGVEMWLSFDQMGIGGGERSRFPNPVRFGSVRWQSSL